MLCCRAAALRAVGVTKRLGDVRRFAVSAAGAATPPKPPPITLLGGFLGTGKTTTLQSVLTNDQGRRVGLIVNDVAEVNIDAKLVRRTVETLRRLRRTGTLCEEESLDLHTQHLE